MAKRIAVLASTLGVIRIAPITTYGLWKKMCWMTLVNKILGLLLVSTLLNGCTENAYLRKDKLSESEHHYPHKVYLENEDSTYLTRWVIDSGVFSFSEDRYSEYHLRLLPDEDFQHCGGLGAAMLGSAIFLGLLPFTYSDDYQFFYEISHEGKATRFSYKAPLYSRYSIWEWLFKPFSKTRGELIVENLKYLEPELEIIETRR